jgi:aminomethyltransferase
MSETEAAGSGSEPGANRTAFYDVQAAMGATFMEEGGWVWTDGFGDTRKEYDAVRDAVGVWDVSPLNKWEVRGRDALAAAQRLHSGDVLGLEEGQVRYGAFCDPDGLMTDDGTVFKLADDHVWVMTNSDTHVEEFAAAIEGMDAGIEYVIRQMPHLQVQGPKSRETLAPVTDADLSALRYFRFLPERVKVSGIPVWLSRTGFSGELGYELFVDPENAGALWQAMVDLGCVPFGTAAVEILRIESGMVVTDYDYEPHSLTPYDLSFDRLVALDRDFIGKPALTAAAADPPRRLMALRLDGDTLPEYGAAVTRDGEPAGTLTSPTSSPRFGNIGIAILDARFAGESERLDVAVGDGTAGATVARNPLYDPDKRRVRL